MPHHSIVLESPWRRIKLVPPTPDDDEAVVVCRTHPSTRQHLRFLPEHLTVEDIRIRRESRGEDKRVLDFHVHLIKEDGSAQFAGMTGYFNIDESHSSCEAGIVVAPEFYGKNLATEIFYVLLEFIFEDKKFHRVTFETGADNLGMQAWLERVAGARLEAQRKEVWKALDGTFSDVRGYAILEDEWRDHVRAKLAKRMERVV
ncbi:hypothetical protein D9613_000779 [Agrocybe pediades]|uniref:N-acetyltransferase domain-containing protein n=1 Tax=Agrocybe pediades TaxID=84607 RepID=A0A8H4R2N9_9AGAR|nr:hypothetical protein D9613_000779 [Agrocybe pediades]